MNADDYANLTLIVSAAMERQKRLDTGRDQDFPPSLLARLRAVVGRIEDSDTRTLASRLLEAPREAFADYEERLRALVSEGSVSGGQARALHSVQTIRHWRTATEHQQRSIAFAAP